MLFLRRKAKEDSPGLGLSGVTGALWPWWEDRAFAAVAPASSFACLCRECKRTQGVSTTDLVGRMLLMTKAHHSNIVSQGALGELGHRAPTALPSAAPHGAEGRGRAPGPGSCVENGQGQQNNLLVFASACLR